MMSFVLRVMLCLVVLATAACTLIHVEGSSNTATDIGGHGGTLAVPESTVSRPAAR
ncbi:hypothetical protein R75461_08440 [Paraburkholderia nemoris]|uniref:hypothetical protein n=1 Tax=Paraburkholderia nemoris TaxID=2793076 RepID=UPI00190A9A14|nr:hypothetical protein [Paraburkholderia nemoris]MBK3787223.1 hypothetical protein [Paraburkholderia aspalathi]CAE6868610.1 hypothetical protein R75461_08440 [Paraburkholderia nemoris]